MTSIQELFIGLSIEQPVNNELRRTSQGLGSTAQLTFPFAGSCYVDVDMEVLFTQRACNLRENTDILACFEAACVDTVQRVSSACSKGDGTKSRFDAASVVAYMSIFGQRGGTQPCKIGVSCGGNCVSRRKDSFSFLYKREGKNRKSDPRDAKSLWEQSGKCFGP